MKRKNKKGIFNAKSIKGDNRRHISYIIVDDPYEPVDKKQLESAHKWITANIPNKSK